VSSLSTATGRSPCRSAPQGCIAAMSEMAWRSTPRFTTSLIDRNRSWHRVRNHPTSQAARKAAAMSLSRFGRAQRLIGRPSGQPHHLENALGIAIERHQGAPLTTDRLCHFTDWVTPCTRPSLAADAEKPRSGKTGASAACRCAGPTGQSASLGDITMPSSECRYSTEKAIPNRPN
jgi:hypothetical protein